MNDLEKDMLLGKLWELDVSCDSLNTELFIYRFVTDLLLSGWNEEGKKELFKKALIHCKSLVDEVSFGNVSNDICRQYSIKMHELDVLYDNDHEIPF